MFKFFSKSHWKSRWFSKNSSGIFLKSDSRLPPCLLITIHDRLLNSKQIFMYFIKKNLCPFVFIFQSEMDSRLELDLMMDYVSTYKVGQFLKTKIEPNATEKMSARTVPTARPWFHCSLTLRYTINDVEESSETIQQRRHSEKWMKFFLAIRFEVRAK